MEKNYDEWNKKKKIIHTNRFLNRKFKEGEIWWCSAGLNIGHEIDGKHNTFERPFYILKKCNNTMFIGIPCTTNLKRAVFTYFLKIMNWEFILNFSQIKSLSLKRLLRRMINVSSVMELDIKNKFIFYINRKPTS